MILALVFTVSCKKNKHDGSTVTLVTDVTGPERGVTRVQSQTAPNNNVVVSTLIPL